MVNGWIRQQTRQVRAWAQGKSPQQGQNQPSGVALGRTVMHSKVRGSQTAQSAGTDSHGLTGTSSLLTDLAGLCGPLRNS